MKLFLYYSFCSFKNQLKKIFKTWVLIFILACALIGGIIGVTVASFEDAFEQQSGYTDEIPDEIIENEVIESEDIEDFIDESPSLLALCELILSGVLILMFFTNFISGDKNGSAIFLPADVNILFSSPLKPQSVLLFRIACQMSASLFASFYILFQIPNLVLNAGMRVIEAFAIIVLWFFILVYSKLLNVFVYTFSSTYLKFKKLIRPIGYGFLGALALGFYLYHINSGVPLYESVFLFFNAPFVRYIPVYGWFKLFLVAVFENNILNIILSFVLLTLGVVVLVYIIWKLKADFYEDAMQKSEETAELMQAAQTTGFAVRKKDRSEKVKRDGEIKGEGASVFYHISLYNRRRFAHFGIFTKTNVTYLVAAVLISFVSLKFLNFSSALPAVFVIGFLAFYRSLGNPISRDLGNKIFLSCPDSIYNKMFYSHLGGSVNCVLDLLPAILLASVYFEEGFIFAILAIVFIASIDLYSGSVGAFIDTATPSGAAKTIKSILQIMFIYFGLLPIIVLIALGFLFKLQTLFILLASIFAIICAAIFFFFTGMILQRGKN